MTYTIELDPQAQQALEADAAAHGLPANEWAAQLLLDAIQNVQAKQTADVEKTARRTALQEARRLAAKFSTGNRPLSDYAVSRESMYEGRGL
jgi:hypothetical protein